MKKLLKESQVGGEGPRNFSLFAPLPSAISHRSLNEAITIQHEVEETTPQHYSPRRCVLRKKRLMLNSASLKVGFE